MNDTISELKSPLIQDEFCSIEDSPFYIHKLAQTKRLNEFKRIYSNDPSCLILKDKAKKWLPIHYALFKSQIDIVEFILNIQPDMINISDSCGNTLLHFAIEHNKAECLSVLLNRGADTTKENKLHSAPIHHCVLWNRANLLELLLSHPVKVDPNYTGVLGETALHYCTYNDNVECARILLKYGAQFCKSCDNGFLPVHLAAQHNCISLLEFLIQSCFNSSFNKTSLLNIDDGNKNKPLMNAVEFGNVLAVQMCLDNGSRIDETNGKFNHTPVHVASSQGSLDILRMMKLKQPDIFMKIIQAKDIQNGHTPLHKASMFNHLEVVNFLLGSGSVIDAVDHEDCTPLMVAASRQCLSMVIYLIQKGADVNLKDNKKRNFLNLLVNCQFKEYNVIKHSSIKELVNELTNRKDNMLLNLLNEHDSEGCTVMHYVSCLEDKHLLKTFIKYGGDVNSKCNLKRSSLHYATSFGRFDICIEILHVENFRTFINERDIRGLTALHLAAENKHPRIVQLLIEKGAFFYNCYQNGNSPFHVAAFNGSLQSLKIIHHVDVTALNSTNKHGDTALHLAAEKGNVQVLIYLLDNEATFNINKARQTFIDVAIKNKQNLVLSAIISHDRWEEVFSLESADYITPFIGIIQFCSHLTKMLMDRCITIQSLVNKKCTVKYNFKYLNHTAVLTSINNKRDILPLLPLNKMIEYGRDENISHSLVEILLQRKWSRYGLQINVFFTLMYLMFLLSLSTIVLLHQNCLADKMNAESGSISNCDPDEMHLKLYVYFKENHLFALLSCFCIAICLVALFKDFYWRVKVNIQSIIGVSLKLLTVSFLVAKVFYELKIEWGLEPLVMFLAWFNLMLVMQRSQCFGIYVIMFMEILQTLLRVMILFSILLVAFGLVFFILLRNSDLKFNIRSPFIMMLRTVVMMLGEMDGMQSFIGPYIDGQLQFGNTTLVFLMLFIVLVPILLTNLLIGLAVGDIESIRKGAKLKKQAMQIQMFTNIEVKLPKRILNKLNECQFEQELSLSKVIKECNDEYTTLDLKKQLNSIQQNINQQAELITMILTKINNGQ